MSVSSGAGSTASAGTPSTSAAIWGSTVAAPWPISVWAVRIRTRPSAASSIPAVLARVFSPLPVKPAPCQPSASPTPDATRPAPGWMPWAGASARAASAWRASRAWAVRLRSVAKSEASSARSRTAIAATLWRRTWPVAVMSPSR